MAVIFTILCAIFTLYAHSTVEAHGQPPVELQDEVANIRAGCLKESGLADASLIEKTLTGHFENDHSLGCYAKCVYDIFGVIGKNGELHWDQMLQVLPPSLKAVGEPIVAKCRQTEIIGDDACWVGLELTKCFYNANPDAYFVI